MSNEPDVRLRSQLVSFGAFSHIRLRVLVVKVLKVERSSSSL